MRSTRKIVLIVCLATYERSTTDLLDPGLVKDNRYVIEEPQTTCLAPRCRASNRGT